LIHVGRIIIQLDWTYDQSLQAKRKRAAQLPTVSNQQISPTDPDLRSMAAPPLQVAVEAEHHLIVTHEVCVDVGR
jgi:hypothetical protein